MLASFKQLKHGNRKVFAGFAVAAVLLLGGAGLIIAGIRSQQNAAPPSPSANGSTTVNQPGNVALPYSKPISLSVPTIGIDASLITVGKNPDDSIQVPAAPNFDNPAWYKYSPAPGQYGASVIVGHVDSYDHGASVFFNLGKLKPKDKITVKRVDGKVAVFSINAVRQYAKDDFPTDAVYGGSANAAELRLITCSGEFDESTGHYRDNIVVFASLTN